MNKKTEVWKMEKHLSKKEKAISFSLGRIFTIGESKVQQTNEICDKACMSISFFSNLNKPFCGAV